MTLDKIEVNITHKHFSVREIMEDGRYHRRTIMCNADVSSEVQEIQDKAEEVWTDEVKSAWAKFQEEQQAEMEAE